jgi:hypothetical protein
MKTSFATIFLVVFMLFSFQNVNAAKSCEDSSLPVKLTELQFVGITFLEAKSQAGIKKSDACFVMDGIQADPTLDMKTKAGCKVAAINPGNPYYLTEEKQAELAKYSPSKGGGTPDTNNLGYYFCFNTSKRLMCESRKKSELSQKMDINWIEDKPGTVTNNDGDCYCKKKGEPGKGGLCPAEPTPIADADPCQNDPDKKLEGGKCVCKSDGTETKKGEACPKQAENPKDMDIENCVKDLKEARDKCANQSRDAINKCNKDAPEFNKNVDTAQQVLNFGIDALIAKKAGTGALDTCVRMGAAGTVIIQALNVFRDNCSKEIKACKNACDEVNTLVKKSDEEYVKECKAMAAGNSEGKDDNEAPSTTYAWTDKLEATLLERLKVLKEEGESVNKMCVADVEKEKFEIDDFFNQLDDNVRKANICECKLSVATGPINDLNGNCDGLVGPSACIANPNQAPCGFSTVGCAPNSTLPGCRIVNQVAAAPTGGLNAPPAGFAGGGFAGSGGGGGTLKPSGGITLSDGEGCGIWVGSGW